MKKKIAYILYVLWCSMLCCSLASCGSDYSLPTTDDIAMGAVTVTLSGIDDDLSGMPIQLRNIATNSTFQADTDQQGTATFSITPGVYQAAVSVTRQQDDKTYAYNGTSGQLTVYADRTTAATIALKRIAMSSKLVIKELYSGGCMADNGVDKFQYDKCVILYNNGNVTLSLDNLCFGMAAPANAQANNNNYTAEGRLNYEDEGFIPVWNGIWYFPATLTLEPYQQVVVNIHGAINNTLTVSQSVNYAHADYYCMYDPESGYNNTRYYPTPSEIIPTSHYLKAALFAQANAWPLSVSSPGLVIFQTKDTAPADFAQDPANFWYDGGGTSITKRCVMVPNAWIVDAVEVYSKDYQNTCQKRLTADIDAGYVWLSNYKGHSVYRNVDQADTEALEENAGKLVYDYALGVDGSTDPSGIDAEASIQNGAHILYQDTNHSNNDFHERQQCSLRK